MAKKETFTTPAGRALYPKLTEPDTKFKEAGEYSTKLLLTAQEAAPIIKRCEEIRQQAFDEEFEKQRAEKPKMAAEKIREKISPADLSVKPYEDPETGEETGDFVVNFKMTASGVSRKTGKEWTRRPALFDAQNKPITPEGLELWSGSVLKVAYTVEPFYTSAVGAGASLRLEAVQIIELVSGGARNAAGYGFDAQEDGYSHTASEKSGGPFVADAGSDEDAGSSESDF